MLSLSLSADLCADKCQFFYLLDHSLETGGELTLEPGLKSMLESGVKSTLE